MLGNMQIVLPVFILIAAGYLAAKTKVFSSEHADIVMVFAQKFGLPALLFTAVAKLDLAVVFQPELLVSFYTGSTFTFIAAALIARFIFKRPPGTSVAVGFTGMFSNTVLLGIPIVERAYGTDALQPVYAIIAIHASYGYLLGITTMEVVRSGGQPIGKTLLRIIKEISSMCQQS